ncbi:MAG: hypothetical protein R3C39_07945 [Dehalococcoidia bacterium]
MISLPPELLAAGESSMLRALPTSRVPVLRHGATTLLGLVAAGALVACGGGNDDPGWSAQAIAESGTSAVQPILVNSGVGVGEARLAFGLFDRDGNLLNEVSEPKVRLYTLDGEDGTLAEEYALSPSRLVGEGTPHEHADGEQHLHEGPVTTVFVSNVELTQPEWWGAELSFGVGDETFEGLRLRFFVQEDTSEPAVGEAVPASKQLTVADVDDISLVDTAFTPNAALHDMTVADALASGRPSVIAFATPLFCQTRFCGPVVEQVVTPIWEQYGDRVNVMAIEPYDVAEARAGQLVPVATMQEWGLQTEPWIFVVDGEGRVVAKFEGIMGLDEVSAAVDRVLASG